MSTERKRKMEGREEDGKQVEGKSKVVPVL
jgi:hypothetical protein